MNASLTAAAMVLSLAAFSAMAAEPPLRNRYVPTDETPWYKEAPNIPVDLAALWGDRAKGEGGTLLRTPPGFDSGLHSHTADYWALVVEGEWAHWVPSTGEGRGVRLLPGAHWTQVHTQLHQDACVSNPLCHLPL